MQGTSGRQRFLGYDDGGKQSIVVVVVASGWGITRIGCVLAKECSIKRSTHRGKVRYACQETKSKEARLHASTSARTFAFSSSFLSIPLSRQSIRVYYIGLERSTARLEMQERSQPPITRSSHHLQETHLRGNATVSICVYSRNHLRQSMPTPMAVAESFRSSSSSFRSPASRMLARLVPQGLPSLGRALSAARTSSGAEACAAVRTYEQARAEPCSSVVHLLSARGTPGLPAVCACTE